MERERFPRRYYASPERRIADLGKRFPGITHRGIDRSFLVKILQFAAMDVPVLPAQIRACRSLVDECRPPVSGTGAVPKNSLAPYFEK